MSMSDIKQIAKVKAIFSDLDNTLWDGILAEGEQVLLRTDYLEFLKSLYNKGVLLFLVSKNDHEDVLRVMDELKIDKEIFVTIVANWDPKYLNVEKLIRQTKLRPETVVFIDDNPFERQEVKNKVPDIVVLDDKNWSKIQKNDFIQRSSEQSQTEIQTRINRYRTALEMEAGDQRVEEDEEFLRSLKRQIRIKTISPDKLGRFTRLLVETHRINFNPDKFLEYESALEYLHGRLNEGDELYAVSTGESDLSLGLTGAFVINVDGEIARITDGTFSCGVMGRNFEDRAVLELIEIFKKRGIKQLEVLVTFTQTNKRVRDMLESIGLSAREAKAVNGSIKAVYSGNLDVIKPKNMYEWIEVVDNEPDYNYAGIISVINFLDQHVKPLIQESFHISNLGSATGEVFGFEDERKKNEWQNLIKGKNIDLKNIDIEHYSELDNIVGNAEDLTDLIETGSQDLVVAAELLEHTEHFWKAINEMIRITKIGGHIFITVPTFRYPKHEYPIDEWRIGPKTLMSFFPEEAFTLIALEKEGDSKSPRRVMVLVRKDKNFLTSFDIPEGGRVNWKTGLTEFD